MSAAVWSHRQGQLEHGSANEGGGHGYQRELFRSIALTVIHARSLLLGAGCGASLLNEALQQQGVDFFAPAWQLKGRGAPQSRSHAHRLSAGRTASAKARVRRLPLIGPCRVPYRCARAQRFPGARGIRVRARSGGSEMPASLRPGRRLRRMLPEPGGLVRRGPGSTRPAHLAALPLPAPPRPGCA